jgi:hypothetical protein
MCRRLQSRAHRLHRNTNQFSISIHTHSVQVLDAPHTVDKEHTVKVIDLVVHHYGIKTLEDTIKGSAPFIQSGYAQIVRTYCFTIQPGKAEATIKVSLLVACPNNLGVDQGYGRIGLSFILVSTAQSHHDDSSMLADLRSSQTNTV